MIKKFIHVLSCFILCVAHRCVSVLPCRTHQIDSSAVVWCSEFPEWRWQAFLGRWIFSAAIVWTYSVKTCRTIASQVCLRVWCSRNIGKLWNPGLCIISCIKSLKDAPTYALLFIGTVFAEAQKLPIASLYCLSPHPDWSCPAVVSIPHFLLDGLAEKLGFCMATSATIWSQPAKTAEGNVCIFLVDLFDSQLHSQLHNDKISVHSRSTDFSAVIKETVKTVSELSKSAKTVIISLAFNESIVFEEKAS